MNEFGHPLPRFPGTRPFDVADRYWYESFYGTLPPFSDQSFANLLVWGNLHDDLSVGLVGDNIVFLSTEPFSGSGDPAAVLLGPSIDPDAVDRVFDGFPALKSIMLCGKLDRVTEESKTLRLGLDRDQFDYLYNVKKHLAMAGAPYRKLRYERRRFLTEQGELRVTELDLADPAERNRILAMALDWSRQYPSPNDQTGLEYRALARRLAVCAYLDHRAYELHLGTRAVAFGIGHAMPQPGWIQLVHLKCDYSYAGIFNTSCYSIFAEFDRLGYDRVNLERVCQLNG
ncbi:phosphatidylglycerol lysyltransferase domain-containing protein [Streptomyces sp. NPDC051172]|uniref:phosphatidylglycerol lysyltransferase domain-containing protein n=1 Tax=Streptomyces sp. NPDC051172 TaxID=3155796 RepID=UPI003440EB2C